MVRIKGDAEGAVPESQKTQFPVVALIGCLTKLHSFCISIYKFVTRSFLSVLSRFDGYLCKGSRFLCLGTHS